MQPFCSTRNLSVWQGQELGSTLVDLGSGELRTEGWQPVPRPESPLPEGVDWELLSPSQMSRAGSTPRCYMRAITHIYGLAHGCILPFFATSQHDCLILHALDVLTG